ncbi:hypothetical protein HPB50_026247 [Hyalomma asiaticum]|uniref:Uncharacterized protein n=1 Tax=Hyalomma asiaticum TaxID=266040 RepID=A0ACB7SA59_HYAAI|nr:hypothetical protein HPB50_026247 [Hyalomma asiaticum]
MDLQNGKRRTEALEDVMRKAAAKPREACHSDARYTVHAVAPLTIAAADVSLSRDTILIAETDRDRISVNIDERRVWYRDPPADDTRQELGAKATTRDTGSQQPIQERSTAKHAIDARKAAPE